jgi:hypothetical protein
MQTMLKTERKTITSTMLKLVMNKQNLGIHRLNLTIRRTFRNYKPELHPIAL